MTPTPLTSFLFCVGCYLVLTCIAAAFRLVAEMLDERKRIH